MQQGKRQGGKVSVSPTRGGELVCVSVAGQTEGGFN